MRSRRDLAGFSLIELVTVLTMGGILLGLALYSLRPGISKTSTLSLAAALSDDFRSARQLAISRGTPVAVGFSTKNSEIANATYRLEGWNVPLVTGSVGYSGDYPRLGFAAASWSGAAVQPNPNPPPLSKFAGFDLAAWIPDEYQQDSILCFTPDGGVLSHNFPCVSERYTAVVAIDPVIENRRIVAGHEPCVIYISATGAVEYSKDIPAVTLAPGQSQPRSKVADRQKFDNSAVITISDIVVRPKAVAAAADAFCSPGEQVTFEVYAYDPEGRQLFAQWKQNSPSGKKGNFGFPRGRQGPLNSEVERMEYVEKVPPDIDWSGGGQAPTGGCFRARWSFTVPSNSEPGEEFKVTADVQDATGEATILNPPEYKVTTAPHGRFLAEIENAAGHSQIVRINRSGKGIVVLTQPGLEECMPSVDRSGTKLAFLQGPPGNPNQRYVKVRSLAGGGEHPVAGPGRYTSVSLSPNGAWVAYRRDEAGAPGQGRIFVKRLGPGSAPAFNHSQNWRSIPSPPDPIEPDRAGWTPDSKHVLWAAGGDGNIPGEASLDGQSFGGGQIWMGRLRASGDVDNVRVVYTYTWDQGQIYSPTVVEPPSGGKKLLFTIGTINPVIALTNFSDTMQTYGNTRGQYPDQTPSKKIDLNGAGGGTGSGNFDDTLVSVSFDGTKIVLPRIDRPDNNKKYAIIARWNDGADNFVASVTESNTIEDEIKSIVWLP